MFRLVRPYLRKLMLTIGLLFLFTIGASAAPAQTNKPTKDPTATNLPAEQPAPSPDTSGTNAPAGGDTYCRFPNLPIPDDDPNGVTDTQVIVDSGTIQDMDMSLVATHTWVGDLRFTLTHQETGTSVTFLDRPGVPASTNGCGGDNLDVGLDDEALSPVEDQCEPGTPTIDGVFTPNNPLAAFDGEDLAGTWVLTASDNAGFDTGTLNHWCMYVVTGTAVAPNLTIVKEAAPADGTDFLFTSDLPVGTYLDQWGSLGSGDGQVQSPKGIAVDGMGNVYVVDQGNHRIQKFDADGTYLTQWGNGGSGDGEFGNPSGVAVDAAGNVYVGDSGNDRIQKFSSDGTYITQRGSSGTGNGQFNYPTGVAVDTAGNVYVGDSGNDRIQKFTADGTYLTQWGSSGSGNGQFNFPSGVAVDGVGNVYVGDSANDRIQKFSADGTYLTQWGGTGNGNGQFSWPYNVTVDAAGEVYVAEAGNDRIQKFSANGTYLAQWGGPGSGDGQFNWPRGMGIDGAGNMFVADDRNHRVQKFTTNVFHLDDASPDDGDGVSSTRTFADLSAGTYMITENLPGGWSLDDITCDGGSWTPDLGTQTLSITLAEGDDVTCTFTNTGTGSGDQTTVYLPLMMRAPLAPQTLVSTGTVWKYLDNGSDQGSAWRNTGYNDSTWQQGAAQLGYGDGDETTMVGYGPDTNNKYITTYFRHTFTVDNPAAFSSLDFHLLRDDGAVVYLNGQEVIRSNMPAGTIDNQTVAAGAIGGTGESAWHDFTVDAAPLVVGTNVLAVEIHQHGPTSSDISFDLSLTGLPATAVQHTRFAVIGDYGNNTAAEAAVANLVHGWTPDYVITLGDNNYNAGEQATIVANIDDHYGAFIEDQFEITRFFPSLGNHDWGSGGITSITCTGGNCTGPYMDHFDLPGNERTYDFVQGPVHFFVLDSDPREPDGNTANSVQAAWLQDKLASATEPWKVVYFHHAPYSSGSHGDYAPMQWPFREWGASVVMAGHEHSYERLIVQGLPYFVNGAGGATLRPCGSPRPGSQICYADDHGAMLVEADYCHMTLTFTTQANTDIDTVLLQNGRCQ